MHELADQLLSYLRATWRYRWYAVVFTWIIALGGWSAVYLTPDRYVASARVYVDTQSVLRPLLSGLTVQPNIDEMITMMSRTLISRPNLEKVIRMADMDTRLKTSKDQEQLITHLTRELAIRSAGRENLYTISYSDKNPQEAKQVVQSLLTLFVEGSLGDKRKDSDAARRFIDEQLKSYSEKLIAAENAVTEFKRRNVGLMPGDRRDYYTRLVEAKAAVSQAELDLIEAENVRNELKRQLVGDAEIPSLLGDKSKPEPAHPEIDARIQALQKNLDSLRLNYTEQHPDIIAATRIIAQLQEQKKQEAKLTKQSPSTAQTQDPVYQQLSVSLASAEANVAAKKARVAEFGKRYHELRAAVNAVPQVEAEYTQLTRDYESTRASYDKLLLRRESAQISRDMEANANVMDFRVIDPPQVPLVPAAPNRHLLMSLVLVVALGGGLGLAFLISQIRPTFDDERRLREVSGLPVFGTVVMVRTKAQKARRKTGLVALLLSFLSLLSAYGAIMVALVLTASRV